MIDFLGIGAQKAGTTWLTENLSMHPDVWTPFMKELHYFDTLHLDWSRELQMGNFRTKISWMEAEIDVDARRYFNRITDDNYCFTDDWYRYIFSAAPVSGIKGEFTPYYSCLNIQGIEHVKRLAPNVKMIYLIRDPIDRAVSSLRMELNRNPSLSQLQLVTSSSFQARGDYRSNISQWESVFDTARFLYMPFGRVKTQPEMLMAELESFLGLKPFSGYSRLDERVFASAEVPIDRDAMAVITAFTAEQYDFLNHRFGAEFVATIS